MSKPGLGKGLGDLMNGDQVAGQGRVLSAATAPPVIDRTLGRGLTSLVSPSKQTAEAETNPVKKAPLLPSWFFFAADILLLAYVVAITFDATRPFDAGTIAICGVSIVLGCTLAVLGVIRA